MADVYKFTMDMTKVLGAPEEDKPNGLMTSLYPKKRPTPADPQVAAKPKADGVQPTAMTKLDTLKSDFARIAIETQGEEEINKLYANQWDKSPTTFDRIRTNLLDRWGADTTVEPSPPRDTPAKPQMERPKRPYMLDASNMPDIPSIIDDVPVADAGEGLMSKPLTDDDMGLPGDRSTTETDMALLQLYTDDYASVYLKEHEGLVAHKSLEGGKDTAALGVKFPLGLNRKDYNSDESFAAAVALKHKDKAKAKFTDANWAALPQSVKFALTDLNFNVGTIGTTADKTTVVDQMKNTLAFIGMTTKAGDKASLIALAKRRAWNWNESSGDIKQEKITKIKQIPTATGGTTFEYLDANANVIYSTTTTRTPVKLDSKGVATTLTKTREVTL